MPNQLHHRKKIEYARNSKKRKLLDRFLIVCEGEKTEIQYFKKLIQKMGINKPLVEIKFASKNTPVNIIKFGKKIIETEGEDTYTKAFFVFDKDHHTEEFTQAINLTKKKYKGVELVAAYSVPCFEYWLLLHVKQTSKPYETCNELLKEFATFPVFENYQKNNTDYFEECYEKIDQAKENAKKIISESSEYPGNPCTYVYLIVEAFEKLKKQ